MKRLPGGEIVLAGLADLSAGRETAAGAAVLMASRRLRSAGIDVPETAAHEIPAAHRLYGFLQVELGDAAHSRYNAIVGRVVSFASAAEHAGAR